MFNKIKLDRLAPLKDSSESLHLCDFGDEVHGVLDISHIQLKDSRGDYRPLNFPKLRLRTEMNSHYAIKLAKIKSANFRIGGIATVGDSVEDFRPHFQDKLRTGNNLELAISIVVDNEIYTAYSNQSHLISRSHQYQYRREVVSTFAQTVQHLTPQKARNGYLRRKIKSPWVESLFMVGVFDGPEALEAIQLPAGSQCLDDSENTVVGCYCTDLSIIEFIAFVYAHDGRIVKGTTEDWNR